MGRLALTIGVVVLLCPAVAAWADLGPVAGPTPVQAADGDISGGIVGAPGAATVGDSGSAAGLAGEFESFSLPLSIYGSGSYGQSGSEQVRELPAGPDGVALLLCGLGTLGGWQLTRSARKIQVGPVPAWFHTGAPDQVGHAVLLDPAFGTLPLCWLDRPAGERPRSTRFWQERRSRCDPQFVFSVVAPRGPPILG